MIPYTHAELSAKRYGGIPEDFYKYLFGDHCQVTIYKDGRIQVNEWDHD